MCIVVCVVRFAAPFLSYALIDLVFDILATVLKFGFVNLFGLQFKFQKLILVFEYTLSKMKPDS